MIMKAFKVGSCPWPFSSVFAGRWRRPRWSAATLSGRVHDELEAPTGLPVVQYRRSQFAPFFQDTWKVTRNPTLSYGVSCYLETYAALGQLDPRAYSTDRKDFEPRFGLA